MYILDKIIEKTFLILVRDNKIAYHNIIKKKNII